MLDNTALCEPEIFSRLALENLPQATKVAVLSSGGIESAVLIHELARRGSRVQPIYFECGLTWERVEKHHLSSYLEAIAQTNIAPLRVLRLLASDLYDNHWSTTGVDVPDGTTDDSAVFLPGRNLLLVSKAAVFCALNGIKALALGTLAANPFADATDEFFESFERTIASGLGEPIQLLRPFKALHKDSVIKLGADLPLHLSMSCIQPSLTGTGNGARFEHCGNCNKCAERRNGFTAAGVKDLTAYATACGQEKAIC